MTIQELIDEQTLTAIRATRIELSPEQRESLRCKKAVYIPGAATQVPEGWRLVPLEPTQAMLDAPPNAWPADAKITYAAMLAAAPDYK